MFASIQPMFYVFLFLLSLPLVRYFVISLCYVFGAHLLEKKIISTEHPAWLLAIGMFTEKAILKTPLSKKTKKQNVRNASLHFYSGHRWILRTSELVPWFFQCNNLHSPGQKIGPLSNAGPCSNCLLQILLNGGCENPSQSMMERRLRSYSPPRDWTG